jgi:hypothetical protein
VIPAGSQTATLGRTRLVLVRASHSRYGEFMIRLKCLFVFLLLAIPAAAQSESPKPTPTPATETQRITPQQAEELFRSVDEILHFSSQDTGLAIKHEVKRKLVNRDEVESFVLKHTSEDEDAKRLRRSELVLKKFGLLPRDFDLGKFLVALLKEQVAGYYDPKIKTVNLLDWVAPVQQKPVLAHELTHALQDQSFDLEKFMKAGNADLAEKKTISVADLEADEISTARQAVVEGQAMVVLMDYMLQPMGVSIEKAPQLLSQLKDTIVAATSGSPQFNSSPLYLRAALTFPYRYGTEFVAGVLTKAGKQKAYAGLLEDPPTTSRQIMQPEVYLLNERLPPMPLPNFLEDFKDYDLFDAGSVGEFDTEVIIEQYSDEKNAQDLCPHWRGGYYYAARPKGKDSAPLVLLYVSRWSDAARASRFIDIYAKYVPKRYKSAQESTASKTKRLWTTEEGPVVIECEGDLVIVTENLDQALSDRVAHDLVPASIARSNVNK